MAFGKIRIGGKSWHNKLFVQAYITDRASWKYLTEAEGYGLHARARDIFAEDRAAIDQLYATYRAKLADLACTPEDHKTSLDEWQQAEIVLKEKRNAWFDAEAIIVHEQNAEHLRVRYEAGLVSLCPYFHSVWWALLWYVCLIPAGCALNRKMTQLGDILGSVSGSFGEFVVDKIMKVATFIGKIVGKGEELMGRLVMRFYLCFQSPIDKSVTVAAKATSAVSKAFAMLGAMAIVMALLFSAGHWAVNSVQEWRAESARAERQAKETAEWNKAQEVRAQLQSIENQREEARWQAGTIAREAKRIEDAKLRAENARLEALEHQQFLRDNPEFAEQERVAAEEKAKKKLASDAYWAEQDARQAQHAEMERRMEPVIKEIEFRTTLLHYDLALASVALLILLGFITIRFVIPAGKRAHARVMQTSFVIRTIKFARNLAQRIKALGAGIRDTAILVGQFLRASYRGICPYIEFEKPDQDR